MMAIFGIPWWWQKREPVTPTSATAPVDLPELTREEARNGWSRAALAKYRAEMDRASANRIEASMQRWSRPTTCDTDYPVFGR